MINPFQEDRIRRDVYGLGMLKSPTPDSFGTKFYCTSRILLRNSLSCPIISIMVVDHRHFNYVYVALIPKARAKTVKELRPTLVIHSNIKLIQRCLAKSVQKSYSKENQFAFLKDENL